LITASLFVAVTAFYPQFATLANARDSLDDTAILILLALGEMFVILTGAIDLSVAANVAFTGLCVALMNHAAPGIPVGLLLAAAAGIGAICQPAHSSLRRRLLPSNGTSWKTW